MACFFALLSVMAMFGQAVADGGTAKISECDASASGEESCLLQSPTQQKHTAEVKAHTGRCAHLDALITKEWTERSKKVECMGHSSTEYCPIGKEVQCPGSKEMCSASNPCCTNPCIGVPPYGDAKTFPCPSADPNVDNHCASDVKPDVPGGDCLDPCATPTPTSSPTPTAPPTEAPTLWVCTEDELKNPPVFKQSGMACSTGSTCYSDKIATCSTQATCYATKNIGTCDKNAKCCAGRNIETCTSGSTCWAKSITHCEHGATCVRKPEWDV